MNTQTMNDDSFKQVKQILVALRDDLTRLSQETKATPKIAGLLQNLNALLPLVQLYEVNQCEFSAGFLTSLVSHASTLQTLLNSQNAMLNSQDMDDIAHIKFASLLKGAFEKLSKLDNPTEFLKKMPETITIMYCTIPIPFAQTINARIKNAQENGKNMIKWSVEYYDNLLINSVLAENIISDLIEKIIELKKEMSQELRKIKGDSNPNDIKTIQACINIQERTKTELEKLLNENKEIHEIMKMQSDGKTTIVEAELNVLTTAIQDDKNKMQELINENPSLSAEDVALLENSIITEMEPAIQALERIENNTLKLIALCDNAMACQFSKEEMQAILYTTEQLLEKFEHEKINDIRTVATYQAIIENVNPRVNSVHLEKISKSAGHRLDQLNRKIELLSLKEQELKALINVNNHPVAAIATKTATKTNAFGFFQSSRNTTTQQKSAAHLQTSPMLTC